MRDLVCSGTIALQQGVFGAALIGNGYTPNFQTDHYLTTALGFEVAQGGANAGYTSFGGTITGSTVAVDTTNHEVQWHGTVPNWTNATFTASKMVLYYRQNGGTSTSWPMLILVDFQGDQTVSSGTFAYNQNTAGFGAITVN